MKISFETDDLEINIATGKHVTESFQGQVPQGSIPIIGSIRGSYSETTDGTISELLNILQIAKIVKATEKIEDKPDQPFSREELIEEFFLVIRDYKRANPDDMDSEMRLTEAFLAAMHTMYGCHTSISVPKTPFNQRSITAQLFFPESSDS